MFCLIELPGGIIDKYCNNMVLNDKVIVNSDDFGKSHEVNLGILEGFRRGILTRATLMVNMPYADEAVKMAFDNNFADKIGLHMNLTEGESLTEDIRHVNWIYKNGMTDNVIPYLRHHWKISDIDKKRILCEIKSQFDKYVEYGLSLNHVDSHQHVHNEYVIWKLLSRVGLEYGFKSIRIARNLMSHKGAKQKLKLIYKNWLNRQITERFVSTDYFGSYDDCLNYFDGNGTVEVMVHPVLKDNKLYDIVNGELRLMDKYFI